MRGRRMLASVLVLALVAAGAIGVSQAQAPGPANRLQPEGTTGQTGVENTVTGDIPAQQWVGTTIPYAGRLSDGVGQPVAEGVYDWRGEATELILRFAGEQLDPNDLSSLTKDYRPSPPPLAGG